MAPYYLRPDVKMEPLINQWYAWTHLISPATFAMNTANNHVKIMRSFIRSPQAHARALKDPEMRGGPFLNLPPEQAPEVERFLSHTEQRLAPCFQFAEAVKQLADMLAQEALGGSMEPLYPHIPEPLKGFVELVYDENHQPAIRFLEGLLYKSRYYDPGLQSMRLSVTPDDSRPFMLSTPRLEEQEGFTLNRAFADPGLDTLCRMRDQALELDQLVEALNLSPDELELLKPLLTETPPERSEPDGFQGEGLRVRFFGHACLLIETAQVSILTDPIISYANPHGPERFTFADLPPRIDYVLLTHAHQDHVVLEHLLQLRHKIGTIVVPNGGGALADPSLKLMLRNLGFPSVYAIDEMESLPLPDGSITGIPFIGEHHDLNIQSKTAYLVELADRKLMCAADACNIESELYRAVHAVTGDIDWLFLGMECVGSPLSWTCGSLLTKRLDRKLDFSRRGKGSDCERGLALMDALGCRRAYVYAMGMEPWLSFILDLIYQEGDAQLVESEKFVAACRERHIPAERLYLKAEIIG